MRYLSLAFILPIVKAIGPYRNLADIFEHQLADLPSSHSHTRSNRAGFGYACLVAVNQSLEVVDGNLEFQPGQSHLRGDVTTFMRYQFSCTASYNGSGVDQPQVWVTYSWCNAVSPGWRLTQSLPSAFGEWVNPLIAFIVPSIIFFLTVTRRRRVNVPEQLFPQTLNSIPATLSLLYKIPLAALIVTMDTTVWLITIVAMAGPMLLSGFYEAVLDKRILTFVRNHQRWEEMTIRSRTHLLLVVLLGNLDLYPAWIDARAAVAHLPHDDWKRRLSAMALSNATTSAKVPAIISISPSPIASVNNVQQEVRRSLRTQMLYRQFQ